MHFLPRFSPPHPIQLSDPTQHPQMSLNVLIRPLLSKSVLLYIPARACCSFPVLINFAEDLQSSSSEAAKFFDGMPETISVSPGSSTSSFRRAQMRPRIFAQEIQKQKQLRKKAERNLISMALYFAFFPQLIAGPIIRYHDVAHFLKQRNKKIR